MVRSGRYFTRNEWVDVVTSGHLLVQRWFRLAKQGVDVSLAFLAKVRPKGHALQHMIQFLELSESRENPAFYSCWMDEDSALEACSPKPCKHSRCQDYVKKFLRVQRVLRYGSCSLTILQRSLINCETAFEELGF